MRRLAVLVSLLTAISGALVALSPSPASAEKVPVPYGFFAYGYGVKVMGGQLPAGSGPLAQSVVACNNVAGVTRSNATAAVDIPGLGQVSGLETKVWTRKRGDVVSTYAQHTIADVVLLENITGKISISGVKAWAHVWHDSNGFHREIRSSLLGLKYTPPTGDPINLPLPTPGNPIVIPGVAKVLIGGGHKGTDKQGSYAKAIGLRVKLDVTGSAVVLAKAVARLGETRFGVFGGTAYGLKANVADGLVTLGRNSKIVMPCKGTDGQIEANSVATADVPGLATVGAVEASQKSYGSHKSAQGWEQAKIADVDLLGGQIHVEGVTARAFVKRERGKKRIIRDATGTHVAQITVGGNPIDLDALLQNPIEIPGVVKIEANIQRKLKGGLEVTALRLTLLDGSLAVVDLGVARMRVGQLPTN